MTRSLEQNELFHCRCRDISNHLKTNGAQVSENMVKELILHKLGNTVDFMGEKIAMRSHMYKRIDADLTPAELQRGVISMAALLLKIEVWMILDLKMELADEENN